MPDPPTIGGFFASWELYRDPVLAGMLSGAMLGLVGVYVVLRRLVFLSAAISQTAGLGVALTFWMSLYLGLPAALVSPTFGASVLAIGTALLVVLGPGRASALRDSLLGVAFLAGAAGALALGTRIVEELHDIKTVLFGSAVAVLPEDLWLIAAVAAVVLVLHTWWWRGVSQVAFDPDGARVRRLPVRALEVFFLVTLAVAISVSTRILGALPTFAFSVLPGVAAVRVSPNVPSALALAVGFGTASGFGGYLAAFLFELPVGASQTLTALGFAAVVEVAARLRHLSLRTTGA
jgi:zinc transport system permease protein